MMLNSFRKYPISGHIATEPTRSAVTERRERREESLLPVPPPYGLLKEGPVLVCLA
jgi:hypothetical protein